MQSYQANPSNQIYQSYQSSKTQIPNNTIRRLFEDPTQSQLPLAALIVTISSSDTYDPLFSKTKQEAPEGTRVSVWQLSLDSAIIVSLKHSLENPKSPAADFKDLFEELNQLESSAVVFNFECCGGCSDTAGFANRQDDPEMNPTVIQTIALILNRGYYVMASDFSLKALIAKWDDQLLGRNPFVQIGTYQNSCELRFKASVLKECDSAQLVALGRLSEDGIAKVKAMSDTIVFAEAEGIDLSKEPYSLEILTVATDLDRFPTNKEKFTKAANKPWRFSTIQEHSGPIGQAILAYNKTGGRLIVSSCHWISLTNISTSEENVFECFQAIKGDDYSSKKKAKFDGLSNNEKEVKLQKYAQKMVQRSAPCKYSKQSY